jgi:hypothetical protein
MTQLFYAYSTADARHRDQFEKQLQALKQRGAVTGWESRAIAPGGAWRRDVSPHVGKADVILFLMSADLLASGYLDSAEVASALKRQRDGDARVMTVLLRPANIKSSVVAHLPTLPRDGKPVTRWNSADAAFQAIAAGLMPATASATASVTASASAPSAGPAAPPASSAAPRPATGPTRVGSPTAVASTTAAPVASASGEPALSAIALAPEELGPDYAAVDQPKDRENNASTGSGGGDSSKFVGVSRAGARRVAQLVYRSNSPEGALSLLSTAVHAELAKGAKAEPVTLPADEGTAIRRVASSTAPSPHVSTFAAKGRFLVAAKVMGAASTNGPIDSADPAALSERIVQRMLSRIPA